VALEESIELTIIKQRRHVPKTITSSQLSSQPSSPLIQEFPPFLVSPMYYNPIIKVKTRNSLLDSRYFKTLSYAKILCSIKK
jgi:hypothetical protein